MTIQDFFEDYPKAAVAFSGGMDSAYLLYAAVQAGIDVCAYYVQSQFQPAFELEDARRLTQQIGASMKVLSVDVLSCDTVTANPPDRCYHCKLQIFGTILQAAKEDGYTVILDGTNASDDVFDRPGMRALSELSVLSPLRLAGLTKSEIRRRSERAGLFTWNKPAYACLATRIPTGMKITREALEKTETAEKILMQMGFRNFRVRMLTDGSAKLEVTADQMKQVLLYREEILRRLDGLYPKTVLDLQARS